MHTIDHKQKLLARVSRLRGQIEGIERALASDADCETVLHRIAGARGALAGLMNEVVEDHIQTHLVDNEAHPGALDQEAAATLIRVIRSYLK